MPHFNPQMCEPSCCVNCAGRIILNEDNCTLCWETSGDVIRAELLRDGEVILQMRQGCLCSPSPGEYELRVYCGNQGDGVAVVVDQLEVPSDFLDECTSNGACDPQIETTMRFTVDASGVLALFNGSYIREVNGCYAGLFLITDGVSADGYTTYFTLDFTHTTNNNVDPPATQAVFTVQRIKYKNSAPLTCRVWDIFHISTPSLCLRQGTLDAQYIGQGGISWTGCSEFVSPPAITSNDAISISWDYDL
jgi:hypothetical protein